MIAPERCPLFVDRLAEVLTSVPTEDGYTPDRDRQMDILSRLPDDFFYALAGHLRTSFLEQQKFSRLRGVSFDEGDFDDETVFRGKVFEMLVAADPSLHTPDPIAEELLALMHDPDRFRLGEKLKYYRTPDGAYLYVDRVGAALVVRAIAEAKLGKLNDRAFRQLSERGFRYGLERLAVCINDLDDLKGYGLTEIATLRNPRGEHIHPIIMIAPDVHQILVVPANRDVSDPASLVRAGDFDDISYGQILYLLGDTSRLTIRKAAFSAAEVAALTRVLYRQMDGLVT